MPWLIIILLPIFMLLIGFTLRQAYSKMLIMSSFDCSDVIMLILVIVGSTIFSMEFQNRTILTALYRAKNRVNVFFAKWVTLVLYSVLLHLVAIVFTIIFNYVLLLHPVSWTALYRYQQPLWVNMLANSGVDIIFSIFIISLLCLTSCLINSNTWVIVVNAIIIFMGSDFSASLLNAHVGPSNFIRWNPLNMLNITPQYYNYAEYHLTSFLTNGQIMVATCLYAILFTALAYVAFAHKKY